MLNWPPDSPDINSIKHPWDVLDKSDPRRPTSQHTGLESAAVNVSLSKSTADLHWSCGVNDSIGFFLAPQGDL